MKRRRFFIAKDYMANLSTTLYDWAVYDLEKTTTAHDGTDCSMPLAVFGRKSDAQHMANELNAGRWGK